MDNKNVFNDFILICILQIIQIKFHFYSLIHKQKQDQQGCSSGDTGAINITLQSV